MSINVQELSVVSSESRPTLNNITIPVPQFVLCPVNASNNEDEVILESPQKRTKKEPCSSQQHSRKEKISGPLFKLPVLSSSENNLNIEQQDNKSEHFELICPLKPLQRKSYRNERRYLLPNPLTVQYTGDPGAVIIGSVEVFLVNDAGVMFSKEMQDMLEGIKFKNFDDQNHAGFSLLMRTISGDLNLRLKFVIKYRYKIPPRTFSSDKTVDCVKQDVNEYREEFMSNSFRVESNRKKPLADHPCLISIKPSQGPRNVNQEVSLHGTNFGDGKNIRVRFGGLPVAVIGVDKDTITTVAPLRPDLQPNSRVSVQVGQAHPTRGVIWRPESLFYTYLGDKQTVEQPAATIMVKEQSHQCFPSIVSSSDDLFSTTRVITEKPTFSIYPSVHFYSHSPLDRLAATAVGVLERDEKDDLKDFEQI